MFLGILGRSNPFQPQAGSSHALQLCVHDKEGASAMDPHALMVVKGNEGVKGGLEGIVGLLAGRGGGCGDGVGKVARTHGWIGREGEGI